LTSLKATQIGSIHVAFNPTVVNPGSRYDSGDVGTLVVSRGDWAAVDGLAVAYGYLALSLLVAAVVITQFFQFMLTEAPWHRQKSTVGRTGGRRILLIVQLFIP
jgi:hypothetical protein